MAHIEPETKEPTQDRFCKIQALRMLDIAKENSLDTYLFGGQPEFCVIGTRASVEALQRHMERQENLEEALQEIIDAMDSGNGDNARNAIESARGLVYDD